MTHSMIAKAAQKIYKTNNEIIRSRRIYKLENRQTVILKDIKQAINYSKFGGY